MFESARISYIWIDRVMPSAFSHMNIKQNHLLDGMIRLVGKILERKLRNAKYSLAVCKYCA